jgi:CrcB protein
MTGRARPERRRRPIVGGTEAWLRWSGPCPPTRIGPLSARRPPPATAGWQDPHLLPTHDRRELAAIFTGGMAGALIRTGLAQAFSDSARSWPWATFGVNVVGAFLLGYFITRLQERLPTSSYKRPFLGTGLCGALTTFSTMQLELFKMVQAHQWALASGYALATLVMSFLALAAATAMVRRVRLVI